ncbi:G-protein coupled receptor Mth2-like isoform X6 [Athalia rosae]|uniref:G-protein coupled receptor Mth2-like isoform X6 n=1 Tax=Athalia rosae TaxID=37344 RepID=UPI00203384BC|nr:G-protein coupled receptor Mth2-like isoform X6 [Athalia rosae]
MPSTFSGVLAIVVVLRCVAGSGHPSCPEGLRISLDQAEKLEDGSLYFRRQQFPRSSYWTIDNATFGCPCNVANACVRTCCNGNELLNGSRCVEVDDVTAAAVRPLDENLEPELKWIRVLDDAFFTIPSILCPGGNKKYQLEPDFAPEDEFTLHSNGVLTTLSQTLTQEMYCIGSSIEDTSVVVVVCFESEYTGSTQEPSAALYKPVGMILSIPFLFATFVVYAILPEIRNLYGKTLMCYVGCLVNAYSYLAVVQLDPEGKIPLIACKVMAFTIHFSFLASFFWLNVMCFDIWWTFGGFRALRGSIKQRERKKFFMYSIYAWGCAILLTAVCVIMDFVPGIPDTVIRPEFGEERCWFRTETAKALYFYGPMGLTVLCNIFLFVSTAIKIIRHKKDTAHHLKGTDSRRHDDNKQWFNLYLKLFIVMGINWSMEIISWLCQGPKSLWYITDMGNTLQGVIIFIIFVWKEKIKRLLIKRFGCQGPNFLPRDSTRSAYHSSASRTCTTSIPLHEETNGTPDPLSPSRAKPSLDDSDGV